MCELFAMSASHSYSAQKYLPPFADKARANISGCGIGFFRDGQVHLEKSCEGIFTGDQMHDSFQRLARVIDSRIILSHIRCPKSGHRQESHAQPFTARFLDHHWLFIFTGESPELLSYQTPRPLTAEELLAARVFEYVRDGFEAQMASWPHQSLYQGLVVAVSNLLEQYPGKYSFFLANETVLLAFFNHAEVLLFQPREVQGEALLLTTVSGGLSADPAPWHRFTNADLTRGQLLVISGPDLLYHGHL